MATLTGLVKDTSPPATDTQTSPISIPDGTTLITTKQHNKIIDIISGDDTSKIPNTALDDIAQSKVTNLTTDLSNKAPISHTHAASDVTSGVFPITRISTGTPDGTKFIDDTGTLRTPPTSGSSDHGALTGLGDDDHTQYQLNTEKNAVNGYAGLDGSSKLTGSQQTYGTIANTACVGNDSRLSDARTPLAHSTSHKSGGSDSIKLDELVLPDDNTTLDATASLHGLMPKTDKLKLDGIATAAEVNPDLISQAEAEAGTATTERIFSALRIKQEIDALGDGFTSSSGLMSGGVLTTGTASDEYSISDGSGFIISATGLKTFVSWSGENDRTPVDIATQNITFVGVNSSGTIVEQPGKFTSLQTRTIIVLGVVVHVDQVNVDTVNNEQEVNYNVKSQLFDLANAISFFNISGNLYTANGSNLTINKSVGDMFKMGSNYANDINDPNVLTLAVLTGLTFQYRFSDGSNGVTGTPIDPDNLDDGSGGLTSITNNRWSVQRIYSFTSNNVKIQRGVTEYTTQEAAIDGIISEPYITEPSIKANGLFRGWLIVQEGATDLSDTNTAQFFEAPKFGEGSGTVGGGGGSGGGTTILSVMKQSQTQLKNSNTTLVDDDTLFLPLDADTDYWFEANIIHVGNVTADLDITFTGPSGATGGFSQTATDYDVLGGEHRIGASTINRQSNVFGHIKTVGTPGDLQLRWAQGVSTAVNTRIIIGSWLKAAVTS